MPFTKSYQVFEAFINLFLEGTTDKAIPNDARPVHPMLPIEVAEGENVDFLVAYYKRSGESSGETFVPFYPTIVIQDFVPEVNTEALFTRDWEEGLIDEVAKQREYITMPVPLIFKFQVSVVTKRDSEKRGAFDWFLSKFQLQRQGYFEFNKIVLASGELAAADIVKFRCQQTEVPREDGRFEFVFDFTLWASVHATKPVMKDYLDKINVYLKSRDYPNLAKFFIHEITVTK